MSDDNRTLPYPEPSGDHVTAVIPDETAPTGQPQKRRRRRWPWVLLIIVVVIAALAVVAELVVRAILPGIVRGIVVEQLDLPADQQLDASASGILLPQLIGGRLDELHLTTDSTTLGGITGAADVTATGIPLRGGDLASATGTVRIGADQFTALLAGTELPIDEVTFAAPDATVSGSLSVLGIPIPVALTVTPGAEEGDVVLTPVELQVAGVTLNAQQVAERFGDLAADLTGPQRICIADQLPAGLTVTGLAISGDDAVIHLDVDGAIVTDAALQENGVCD